METLVVASGVLAEDMYDGMDHDVATWGFDQVAKWLQDDCKLSKEDADNFIEEQIDGAMLMQLDDVGNNRPLPHASRPISWV